MQYRKLGRTGLQVSAIGFGGIPIQRISEAEAKAVVNQALDQGINFFDTARGYTDSEVKLGQVLKERRKEAIIATKSMSRTKEGMAADVDQSLANLGVDYIDLYQFHNVKDMASLEQVLSPNGALAALQEAQKAGKIKHIGITGHIRRILVEALKTGAMETVQFPFNVVEAGESQELIDLAGQTDTGIIIMKPLAGGALRNANLALRFILQYPVSTVIPGMDSTEQVDQNALLGHENQALSAEERVLIEKEAAALGTAFCRRCEYCQPCPQGIQIPMIFLLEGYYSRYNLTDWSKARYREMAVKVDACIECGECENKCPYSLPIRQMLVKAGSVLA